MRDSGSPTCKTVSNIYFYSTYLLISQPIFLKSQTSFGKDFILFHHRYNFFRL